MLPPPLLQYRPAGWGGDRVPAGARRCGSLLMATVLNASVRIELSTIVAAWAASLLREKIKRHTLIPVAPFAERKDVAPGAMPSELGARARQSRARPMTS